MRWLAVVVVVAGGPGLARADDGDDSGDGDVAADVADVDDDAAVTGSRERWASPEPQLHLDFVPPVNAEGPGASARHRTGVWDLGPRARLAVQGDWWKAPLTPQVPGPDDFDDLTLGWQAATELSYDLGPFRIGANLAVGHVDGRFERGTYQIVGVAIFRTFELSRWMHAWISLGVGRQQWVGSPPPGEADATVIGLSIGTTFR